MLKVINLKNRLNTFKKILWSRIEGWFLIYEKLNFFDEQLDLVIINLF